MRESMLLVSVPESVQNLHQFKVQSASFELDLNVDVLEVLFFLKYFLRAFNV